MVGWLVGFFVLVLAVGALWAQGPAHGPSRFVPDSNDTAEKWLRNAANLARERQWSEAIEIYQRALDHFGDKVTKVPRDEAGTDQSGDFVLYVDGRRYCHRCLANLPPEARAIYRSRVDSLAERWYRQGSSQRDFALLRRVVDKAFCSSWGDDALELLGDLAFQEGRFGEALAAYGQLVADHPEDPLALIHPDPSVDLARVAAKKLLCRAAGENPPAPIELEAFAHLYPKAEGALAGRKGLYARILAESLAKDHLEPPAQPDGRWPTFAGSFRRTKVVPGPIDVGQVQWRVELEKISSARSAAATTRGGVNISPPTTTQERHLAFHPIVLGDQVIVCDGTRVLAYNLNDRPGETEENDVRSIEPAWKHDPEDGVMVPQAMRLYPGTPRLTLTAFGHRIYARMGVSTNPPIPTFRRFGTIGEPGNSSIVALDWNTQGKLLWEQKSTIIELPYRGAGGS
jgi:hypothetical protein